MKPRPDTHVITGARCSACGQRFAMILRCYQHTIEAHDRQAEVEIEWSPKQASLFDQLDE